MADPRATVRQWLAEVHAAAFANCWHAKVGEPVSLADPCADCLVDAGLTALGIEVTTILRPIDDSRRIALLLPADEGTGT